MAVLSKELVAKLSRSSCNDFVHPHSCRRAAFINFCHFGISNSKYYLPLAILHLLKHAYRDRNIMVLQDTLWYYAQLVYGGMVNGWLIASSICVLRHLLGEFRLYTLTYAPSILGGAFSAFIPMRVKRLQHTAVFQAFIESLLVQRNNFLTRTVASSRVVQTLLFMVSSSIIMLGKERHWHRGFWFLTPETLPLKDSSQGNQFVFEGMRKYLIIGLAMDIFKAVLSCVKTGRWHLKQLRLESMAWLGCYVGIYRTTLCYLQSKKDISAAHQQILASFLGGLSFVFSPKLTILSYALLEAGRTLWAYNKRNSKTEGQRYGYSDLAYPLALAYLIHTYVVEPKMVSALAGIMVDSSTAKYATNIANRMSREKLLHDKKN